MKKDVLSLFAVIAVMWFGHMLVDFMIGIWAVYKTMAGLDLALAGLIAAVSALIGESLQGCFGPMTDKGYRLRLVILGLGLTTASAFMAYTDNYLILFVFFLLTCIGSGAFHPAAVSVMNELSEKRKALFLTIFQSGGLIGMACSQLVFSQAFFLFDGHTFFLAIPSFLLIILVAMRGYGAQEGGRQKSSAKDTWKTFMKFFKTPALSALYCTQLCTQSLFWAIVFMLPDILVGRGYDDWTCYGGANLFLIFGGALMIVPAGYLADKYSCKNVIIGSTLIGALAFYFFLGSPLLSPFLLCATLFVLGASLGTIAPVVVALGNRLSPKTPGMISAFLMGMVWCVAEGIGQGGGGLLTKLFTEDPASYALACLGLLFIIGLASAYRLPSVEKSLELEIA